MTIHEFYNYCLNDFRLVCYHKIWLISHIPITKCRDRRVVFLLFECVFMETTPEGHLREMMAFSCI